MRIFALGFCSITLGAAGTILLPAYFWLFAFCIASGFFCQLAAFWQAHREAVRRLKEHDQWQADIHSRYAEIDEADGEKKVELLRELLNQLDEK